MQPSPYRPKRFVGVLLLLVFGTLAVRPVAAFKPDERGHSVITGDALRTFEVDVAGTILKFSQRATQQVIAANRSVDLGDNSLLPGGEFFDAAAHCDGEEFAGATARLRAFKERVIQFSLAGPGGVPDGDGARRFLGRAFHTLQDFYSHSNWIELGNTRTIETRLGRTTFAASRTAVVNGATGDISDIEVLGPGGRGPRGTLSSGFFVGLEGCPANRPEAFKFASDHPGKVLHGSERCNGIHKDAPGRAGHEDARFVATLATLDFLQQIVQDPRMAGNAEAIRELLDVRSVCFVIDDTGSMGDEIAGVRNAAREISRNAVEEGINEFILVRYGDPDVGPAFRTSNIEQFIARLDTLRAGGGGDCPELTNTGLLQALAFASDDSQIFVFTDADAKDRNLAAAVQSEATLRNIKIIYALTGTCGGRSPIHVDHRQEEGKHAIGPRAIAGVDPTYDRISRATGGAVLFFRNGAELQGALDDLVLPTLAEDFVPLAQAQGVVSGTRALELPVDSTVRTLQVSSTVDAGITVRLLRPSGAPVTGADPGVTLVQLISGNIITVNSPEAGAWRLEMTGNGDFSVQVGVTSPIQIIEFEFVTQAGRAEHEGLFRIQGQPLAGALQGLQAVLLGPATNAEFRLVNEAGETLNPVPLKQTSAEVDTQTFAGTTMLPGEPFRVVVRGRDSVGQAFERIFAPLVRVQTIAIAPAGPLFRLRDGANLVEFLVRNLGPAGPFAVNITDSRGFLTAVTPAIVKLDTNGQALVRATLTVPPNTEIGTDTEVQALVTSTTNPDISNEAVTELAVGPRIQDVSADIQVTRRQFGLRREGNRVLLRFLFLLRNRSGKAIEGPVSLVFDNPGNAINLINPDGQTAETDPAGRPFYRVNVGADEVLAPGELVRREVVFVTLRKPPVPAFRTRVLAGPGNP